VHQFEFAGARHVTSSDGPDCANVVAKRANRRLGAVDIQPNPIGYCALIGQFWVMETPA